MPTVALGWLQTIGRGAEPGERLGRIELVPGVSWRRSRWPLTTGSASTSRKAEAGSSMKKIWRMPEAIVWRRPSTSSRAARREMVGNSTVEMATLNTPWGSR